MKNLISLSLFFTIFTFSLKAQNIVTDSTATLVAYWEKGDTRSLIIEKTNIKYNGDNKPTGSNIKYEASIKVLDATDSSYTLAWKYHPSKDFEKMASVDPYYQLFTDAEIYYVTDENGSFDSLLNYAQVHEIVKKSINYLSDLAASNNPDVQMTDMKAKLLEIFSNREMIEQIVLKDIAIVHNYYGILYNKNNPEQYDALLSNFMGGEPFPASIFLQYIDKKGDDISVSSKQYLDKEKTLPILISSFKKLSKEAEEEFSKSPEIFTKFEMDDKTIITFSQNTGWIKRIQNDKAVNFGDTKKVEQTLITFQ